MKKRVFLLLLIFTFLLFGCTENKISETQTEGQAVDIPIEYPIGSVSSQAPIEEDTEEEKTVAPIEEETEPNAPLASYVKSEVNALAVRSGPGTGYKKIGSLDKGDLVRFHGFENGWYRTEYRGVAAYVFASDKLTSVFTMDEADERTEEVIKTGERYLGTPYVYGAVRLHDGYGHLLKNFSVNKFDCSSFMQYIFFYGADVILRETTRTQVSQGEKVDKEDLRRGDLIFMTNASRKHLTGTERIGHVALYLGEGYILHTASDHAVIEKMSAERWNNYVTARRMI